MRLPTIEDLNEAAQLIGGPETYFEDLGPETRLQIVQLCNQSEVATQLKDLVDTLDNTNGFLQNIDNELEHVGIWFKLSKIWEGH